MKKVPKPKPAFNDGQKLDNSRDWERVKIAQPPIEDLTVQEITTLDPIAEHKETLHDITELLTDDNDNEDVDDSRTEAPLTHSSSSQGMTIKAFYLGMFYVKYEYIGELIQLNLPILKDLKIDFSAIWSRKSCVISPESEYKASE